MKFQVISLKFPPLEWHVPSPLAIPNLRPTRLCGVRLSWNFLLQNLLANDSTPACKRAAKKKCKPAILRDRKVHPPPPIPKKNPSVLKGLKETNLVTWGWNRSNNGCSIPGKRRKSILLSIGFFLLKAMSSFTRPIAVTVPQWMGKDSTISTMTSSCEMHRILPEK